MGKTNPSDQKMKLLFGFVAACMADEPKIIGGNVVSPHSEPYILSLQRSGSHFCGGTITSRSHGICASHCYYAANTVTAVGGAHNIKQNESSQQKIVLSKFVKHPSYNSRNMQNDIAVLAFSKNFNTNNYVEPISMPSHKNNEWLPDGARVRVCGWGNTSTGIISNYPAELHCVNVNIVTVDDCNGRNSYNGQILKGMFCAGVNGGGKDACQGDSGGPTTYNGNVIGATSWGYGCAEANYPGVYTDVAQYRNWIDGEQ